IRLNPKMAEPNNSLAQILATGPHGVRDGKRAVDHATLACELTEWKNAVFLDTLAAACAETGDFDKAIEHQKKALSFPAFEKRYGPEPRKRLDLYEKKKPSRDPSLAAGELAPPPREVKP